MTKGVLAWLGWLIKQHHTTKFTSEVHHAVISKNPERQPPLKNNIVRYSFGVSSSETTSFRQALVGG